MKGIASMAYRSAVVSGKRIDAKDHFTGISQMTTFSHPAVLM